MELNAIKENKDNNISDENILQEENEFQENNNNNDDKNQINEFQENNNNINEIKLEYNGKENYEGKDRIINNIIKEDSNKNN